MRTVVALLLFLILAFVFGLAEQSVLFRWTFLGARPDLMALLVLGVAFRARPAIGATAGFVCGTSTGLSAGAGLVPYTVSLIVVGFVAGLAARSDLRITVPVTGALVALGTLAAHTLAFFMAPPTDVPGFLTATIGSAIMNGVLAMPLDAVWRRLIGEAVD